ncbi:MAG: 50S ribosomal protein L18 [bacterium]|nr:50S ribosomal protein L18 [bacterium]
MKHIKLSPEARRARRVRAKISGTSERPRLSVFRSNRYIYAQLIDDINGVTLASATDAKVRGDKKVARAKNVGALLAEAGKKVGVEVVVFDRASYRYAGRVAALADGAREGGLKF